MPAKRLAPQTIPRQKAYLYVFLICCTGLLLYFYSYPLNMENWEYIKKRNIASIFESIYKSKSNVSTLYEYDLVSESVSRSTNSIILQKLFLNKITTTSTKFQKNEKLLQTSDFEKRIENPEEVPDIAVDHNIKALDSESSHTSEIAENFENSKDKPSTTFKEIIKDFNTVSSLAKQEVKSEDVSSETLKKVPEVVNSHLSLDLDHSTKYNKEHPPVSFEKIENGALTTLEFVKHYENSKEISTTVKRIKEEQKLDYKPRQHTKEITTTTYETEILQSLPTSEYVKNEEDYKKISYTTSVTVESELNFSSMSDSVEYIKNSKEKSATISKTEEQIIKSTPIARLSIVNENMTKLPKPEYDHTAIAVDDTDTAEVIEKHDSATDMHDMKIKETANSNNFRSFVNEHTPAKDANLKFTDADHVTVSTRKDKIISNATNYSDFTEMTNAAATHRTSFTDRYTKIFENTDILSNLNDHLVKKSTKSNIDAAVQNETSIISGVQNGFLVFSENCRIPDLDPMHPSIRHLVEKTPPLDCSKGHEPLTWTEGHTVHLNQTAILQRTSGKNYSCCYRTVKRKNDGKSDDDVEISKKCTEILDKRNIEDEFITVECSKNRSTFYKEFHSFIHDKSEVEKRCNKHNDSKYSVLIIGVDAVSRMNMHRQLNATAQYLLKEMKAVEMYGFNKVGDNTFPNLIPLLVGYDERELPAVCWKSSDEPLDRCNFIWKRYAQKGYRTFYAEDSPYISSFNYIKKGFYHQPTDYYFRHFIRAYEDSLSRDKPLNCYLCVGSVSETEAVLHWTEQFASHFSHRPYFSFSWINSLTHDFLNMGSSGDHMYENFLRSLHQQGALNNTIVILMGDHGMRWGSIRKTYIGRLEERLPMLMIALPQRFKQEHTEFTETLKQNSHRLVTPFDLHATLVHLLDLKNNWTLINPDNVDETLSSNFTKRAHSLFQPIPEDRSCDDAFIEEHWCTCETSLEADISSNVVKKVANFLVDHVNRLLKPVSQKCARLTLNAISDARLWQPPSEHEGHSADDSIYTVIINTKPGGAVFEGTMKISGSKDTNKLLGTISRLNLYGNQSSCIDNAILRKYCYCL